MFLAGLPGGRSRGGLMPVLEGLVLSFQHVVFAFQGIVLVLENILDRGECADHGDIFAHGGFGRALQGIGFALQHTSSVLPESFRLHIHSQLSATLGKLRQVVHDRALVVGLRSFTARSLGFLVLTSDLEGFVSSDLIASS